MKALFFIISLCLAATLSAQEKEMVYLSGATSMEELSENDVERFNRYLIFPLEINRCSLNKLNSCGLFTPYQAAAIKDYIMTYGDILSSTELALVDGMGEENARAVQPFLSFEPVHSLGRKANNDSLVLRQEAMARLTFKKANIEKWENTISSKYILETNKGVNASLALRDELSGNVTYEGGRIVTRLIAGDFYARFGQGLAVWDGFQISMNSVGSLTRRQSGLIPAHTFTPGTARRGLGITANLVTRFVGEASISLFASGIDRNHVPSTGAHLDVYGKRMQNGITAIKENGRFVVSLDNRTHMRRTDISGEVGLDAASSKWMARAGITYLPEYGKAIGLMISHSEKDALYLGFKNEVLEAFASGEYNAKNKATWKSSVVWNGKVISDRITVKVKSSERLKPDDNHPLRSALTVESTYGEDTSFIKWRNDIVVCSGVASLNYIEYGMKSSGSAPDIYLRAGVFHVDSWENRIYVYERDAPGAFNIPAYYGRGWNASLYTTWKHVIRKYSKLSLSARASYVGYAESEEKPSKLEMKIQCSIIL